MPLYLSIAGLRARHGARFLSKGIVSDVNPPDLDVGVAENAIREAESLINTSIVTRHQLPLPGVEEREDPENNLAVPPVLRMLTADIALRIMRPEHDVLTDEIKERHKQALQWLKDFRDSKVSLDLPDATSVPSAIGIHRSGPARVFSRCDTDGLT